MAAHCADRPAQEKPNGDEENERECFVRVRDCEALRLEQQEAASAALSATDQMPLSSPNRRALRQTAGKKNRN
jgi:hypothetical protein